MKHSTLITKANEKSIPAGSQQTVFAATNNRHNDVMCLGFYLNYDKVNQAALLDFNASFLPMDLMDESEFNTFGPSRDSDRGSRFFAWPAGPFRWGKGQNIDVMINSPIAIASGKVQLVFSCTEI